MRGIRPHGQCTHRLFLGPPSFTLLFVSPSEPILCQQLSSGSVHTTRSTAQKLKQCHAYWTLGWMVVSEHQLSLVPWCTPWLLKGMVLSLLNVSDSLSLLAQAGYQPPLFSHGFPKHKPIYTQKLSHTSSSYFDIAD